MSAFRPFKWPLLSGIIHAQSINTLHIVNRVDLLCVFDFNSIYVCKYEFMAFSGMRGSLRDIMMKNEWMPNNGMGMCVRASMPCNNVIALFQANKTNGKTASVNKIAFMPLIWILGAITFEATR